MGSKYEARIRKLEDFIDGAGSLNSCSVEEAKELDAYIRGLKRALDIIKSPGKSLGSKTLNRRRAAHAKKKPTPAY